MKCKRPAMYKIVNQVEIRVCCPCLETWVWFSSMGWDRCTVAGACAVRPDQSWVQQQLHQRRKRSFRLFAAEGEDCWRRETPRKKPPARGGWQCLSIGSGRFLSYRWDLGAGDFLRAEGGRTANRAKKRPQGGGGGEPPATGMARDYDYLFKLLIIGDSGKPTPGMRDGK